MKKQKNRLLPALLTGLAVLLALMLAATAFLIFYMPYHRAETAMPADGTMTLEEQADGKFLLTWPASDTAQYYLVQVLRPAAGEEEEPVWIFERAVTGEPRCQLPQLPGEEPLVIRVNSAADYEQMDKLKTRYGENPMEVTAVLAPPRVSGLWWEADPDSKTVSIDFSMADGDICRCWMLDENGDKVQLKTLDQGQAAITFGEDGDVALPEYGAYCTFVFDAYRQTEGLDFYGTRSASFTVVREDLLGRDLQVDFTDLGDNRCALSWNETKGAYYEVQMQNVRYGQWETVARIDADQPHSYASPRLDPCEHYIYRVRALGGQTEEGSETAAVSEDFDMITTETPIYATVWPTKDLEAYAAPGQAEPVATAKVGKAYCVLEETDGMFGILMDGQTLYIDSNYCMINLPEYLGWLCLYDITNSYDSLYMIHEYEIPDVTGVITGGYEKIALKDGGYLVPLLYPTAQKLVVAAKEAVNQGYQLKIYDAFRPNKATREIYDLTELILNEPLPEESYTGKNVSLPKPRGEELTYMEVMTGGSYKLSAFLAQGASLHNLGIALDLTLVDLQTGRELEMQTSMHDLSFYSVLRYNNESAKTLAAIMKSAGFGELTSEWWHFQDNEIRASLKLPTVWAGVDAACWMADDNGWRYRTSAGSYYTNCTAQIAGTEYTFDSQGYMISE